MIRNTVVNIVNFFYPLGNTPAVSLTQDLPPETNADVLLLGCGDARNILFTCFADPGRKLDITCCDIEPAIVARNILLLTLLIDDVENINFDQIWNIYYHWKLDDMSLNLLESQSRKLLVQSETPSKWRQSAYGAIIRLCDTRTVTKIRRFWTGCLSNDPKVSSRSKQTDMFQKNIGRARSMKEQMSGKGTQLTGIRSVAPAGAMALADFVSVTRTWWNEGTTIPGDTASTNPNHLNPAFLSSESQSLTLHYGLEPLLGFPLATAYVPLVNESCFHIAKAGASAADFLSICARKHFLEWIRAFSKAVSNGLIIRFCVADALTLALTLQNAIVGEDGGLSANFYCDNWTSEPLVLDKAEYTLQSQKAPRKFNVIDTSNLTDHLGPLNMIPACAALLKTEASSTLYTESLVQFDTNEKERLASLLGGETRTIALLLGLSPCEIWTNAANSAEDDSLLNILDKNEGGRPTGRGTQVRSRLRWKLILSHDKETCAPKFAIDPSKTAQLLVGLYDHMFQYENVQTLFSNLSMNTLARRSMPRYNRTGFALLLKSIQEMVNTDWALCLDMMLSRISFGFSKSPIGANFAQELLLYLHILGVQPNPFPSVDLDASKTSKLYPFFKTWPNIPTQVCITIRVPRRNFRLFTSRATAATGTPTIRCDIEGGAGLPFSWSNSFTSIQIAFGSAELSQENGVPKLQILQDDSTWWGESDMFASTFVPVWMIVQPNEITPVMKCGILSTPQSAQAFIKDLGLKLDLFEAEVTSKNVVISQYMPAMSGMPKFTSKPSLGGLNLNYSMTAAFSPEGTTITTITERITYTCETERSKLGDASRPVKVEFQDMFRASIKIGNDLSSTVSFPVPIQSSQHKVRVARKSSYVEIEAPLWDPLQERSTTLLFPVIPPMKSSKNSTAPISWTATRINLDVLPAIDLKDKKSLQWLQTHASMMFSTKERQIREAGTDGQSPPGTKPINRIELKEGLFAMLLQYAGLQGEKPKAFGLSKTVGGIHILILPSCLRLDFVNRTVVLDAAVIPLLNAMPFDKKVTSFYRSLTKSGVMQINVSADELRCWKSLLPALAERCRIWKHAPRCEYTSTEKVPLIKGLEDGHTPLCSCGIGNFPPGYIKDPQIYNLEYLLGRYATRVAISPIFAVPYVEDCFLAGLSLPQIQTSTTEAEPQCGNCGRDKKKDTDIGEGKLLLCSRCKKKRYCSVECQKADWKSHKGSCSRE